jgi:hypothetical protein
MNHEIYKEQMDILILKTSEMYKQINIINNQKSELTMQYIEFLRQEADIKIGDRVVYKGTNCWIYEFALDYFNKGLLAKLKKVKKDGTNGEQSADSYGTLVDKLKRITNE